MLTVLSPAKSLDFDPVDLDPTTPAFLTDANRLARSARNLTLGRLKAMMSISDDLARLNRDRFRDFSDDPAPGHVKPAVLAFAGDTYIGLEAKTLSGDDLRWAQDHLRILSGLYGLLRPLDAIQPYRLEMGSRLKTRRGAGLYDYWGDTIAKALRDHAALIGTGTLINCASQEYFRAADRTALRLRVITPHFVEERSGTTSMVGFFAKRARGAMARFIVEHRLTDPADIKGFSAGGYAFDSQQSSDVDWVFSRPYPTTG